MDQDQQAKVPADKPDDLSLSSGENIMEREDWFPKVVLWSQKAYPTHTYKHTYIK